MVVERRLELLVQNALVRGVLVDQVNEVIGLDQATIERAPTFGSSMRSEFVRGVGRLNNRFVVVLDVQTGEILALANYPSYDPGQRQRLSGGAERPRRE